MEKLTQVGMWNDGTIKWLKWYRLNQYLHVSSVWAILHRDSSLVSGTHLCVLELLLPLCRIYLLPQCGLFYIEIGSLVSGTHLCVLELLLPLCRIYLLPQRTGVCEVTVLILSLLLF